MALMPTFWGAIFDVASKCMGAKLETYQLRTLLVRGPFYTYYSNERVILPVSSSVLDLSTLVGQILDSFHRPNPISTCFCIQATSERKRQVPLDRYATKSRTVTSQLPVWRVGAGIRGCTL